MFPKKQGERPARHVGHVHAGDAASACSHSAHEGDSVWDLGEKKHTNDTVKLEIKQYTFQERNKFLPTSFQREKAVYRILHVHSLLEVTKEQNFKNNPLCYKGHNKPLGPLRSQGAGKSR